MVHNPNNGTYYGPDGRNPNKESHNPNKELGFEISPQDIRWTFIPEFYPEDFTQSKDKKLDEYGGNCGAQSVTIKSIKNREFHAKGVILRGEISNFNSLMDFDGKVDLISPLTPSGGMECFIKRAELGNQSGWDPLRKQRMFQYTLDLVSTGTDERESTQNDIVTDLVNITEPAVLGEGDDSGVDL